MIVGSTSTSSSQLSNALFLIDLHFYFFLFFAEIISSTAPAWVYASLTWFHRKPIKRLRDCFDLIQLFDLLL